MNQLLSKIGSEEGYLCTIYQELAVKKTGLRWHLWQIYLGYFKNLKGQDYMPIVRKHRQAYDKLKAEMKECLENMEDPLLVNPLLKVKEESFEKETEVLIDKDLVRTFAELELFQKPETLAELKNVLMTWSFANRLMGYRQGMNDLVGILYLVRDEQIQELAGSQVSADYKELMNPSKTEHDIFAMLDLLLLTGLDSFYAHDDMYKKAKTRQPNGRVYSFLSEDFNFKNPKLPIVKRANNIYSAKLSIVDPELHFHMEALKLEPQWFMM